MINLILNLCFSLHKYFLQKVKGLTHTLLQRTLYSKGTLCIGTMRVPEGDLHCQCKLSIFSLSSFGPCIVFWILQKGTCIGKCIFSIFPAVTHQLKCKQTCIEKCRPRHKISMKKWLKIHQISKNVNLFPYITTNLHWSLWCQEWSSHQYQSFVWWNEVV